MGTSSLTKKKRAQHLPMPRAQDVHTRSRRTRTQKRKIEKKTGAKMRAARSGVVPLLGGHAPMRSMSYELTLAARSVTWSEVRHCHVQRLEAAVKCVWLAWTRPRRARTIRVTAHSSRSGGGSGRHRLGCRISFHQLVSSVRKVQHSRSSRRREANSSGRPLGPQVAGAATSRGAPVLHHRLSQGH